MTELAIGVLAFWVWGESCPPERPAQEGYHRAEGEPGEGTGGVQRP